MVDYCKGSTLDWVLSESIVFTVWATISENSPLGEIFRFFAQIRCMQCVECPQQRKPCLLSTQEFPSLNAYNFVNNMHNDIV